MVFVPSNAKGLLHCFVLSCLFKLLDSDKAAELSCDRVCCANCKGNVGTVISCS